ncbi:unnamed protein product [Trichobilharzia regenti]|nr:unnamed protein product [Trichobilharzia regenti]
MACPLIINKNSVKSLTAWWLSNESSLNYVGLTPKSGRGKVYIDMHSPDKVRSRVGSIPVHVACSKLNEALLAAGAGADILLTGLDDKMTYVEGTPTKEIHPGDCAVLPDETESPTPPKPKSPGPQPTEEVDSSISAPLKKSRLVVDEGNIPKSTKLNGTPTRNTNPTASDANWSNAASAQNQKRSQRVLRHPQYTPPQRTNVPRSQSPSGLQFFNMANPRLIPPTSAASRTPAMLLQSGLNLNNQISGVLHPPNNQQSVGMRFPIVAPQLQQPPQSMSQRMPTNPTNVLNSNQPIAGGFLNHIQPPCHNAQPQNWQMNQGGASGHPMGGLNLGMRVGNPGGQNMNTCRSCGTPNPASMPFCRNCRAGLR